MKFELKTSVVGSKTVVKRFGKLEFTGGSVQTVYTPTYLVYTRVGHIPHLTWNLVNKHLKFSQTPIYQLTLSSCYNVIQQLNACGGGVSEFLKIPEKSVMHLTLWDPLSYQECGFNSGSSVSLWSKGGRKDISPFGLKIALDVIRPHSFSTPFDYDTPRDCKKKRLIKSVMRATDWCDELCSKKDGKMDDCEIAPFVTLGGGFSPYYRNEVAKKISSRAYSKAFAIDLSSFSLSRPFIQADCEGSESLVGDNFNEAEIKSLLAGVMMELPANSARLVEGPFDPKQIFTLIQLGVDIFDSSYAIWLAEQGKGFKLSVDYPIYSSEFEIVDFNESRYQDDFNPLFECACYSCSNYSKSYLRHLVNTKEMLAQILLVVHNLQEFDNMFARLRKFSQMDCII